MHSYREQMRNHNGRQYIYNPGLADKLRGILSIYSLCKEKHIDFKINWTYPFELTEYLLPNKINWIIEQEKIKYALSDSKIVVIDTLPNIHSWWWGWVRTASPP